MIAFGLAIDTFAVSNANDMTITKNRRKAVLLTAVALSGFQMFMPAVGWAIGLNFEKLIIIVDHWLGFGLLVLIGVKMTYDGFKKENIQKRTIYLKLHTLLILAIATSIDALMLGLSFAFLQTSIFDQ